MHRSRLAGLIIDCRTDDLGPAADFWGAALGYAQRPSQDAADDNYVILATASDEPHIELQKVGHPSRVHIDIESDDIEAEVRRLEKLGAKRISKVKSWWILEAPTGHRFCVVRPQRADFGENARQWAD